MTSCSCLESWFPRTVRPIDWDPNLLSLEEVAVDCGQEVLMEVDDHNVYVGVRVYQRNRFPPNVWISTPRQASVGRATWWGSWEPKSADVQQKMVTLIYPYPVSTRDFRAAHLASPNLIRNFYYYCCCCCCCFNINYLLHNIIFWC